MKSRPHFGGRDLISLAGRKGGRDMWLASRPGLVVQEVATRKGSRYLAWGLAGETKSRPCFEVATWDKLPGRVATSARPTCVRLAHAELATCAGCARDMHATSLLCAQQRPQPGHCARSVRATWVLGVRTVHPTQF